MRPLLLPFRRLTCKCLFATDTQRATCPIVKKMESISHFEDASIGCYHHDSNPSYCVVDSELMKIDNPHVTASNLNTINKLRVDRPMYDKRHTQLYESIVVYYRL